MRINGVDTVAISYDRSRYRKIIAHEILDKRALSQIFRYERARQWKALVSWRAVQVEKFSSNLCEVPDHKRIDAHLLRRALA